MNARRMFREAINLNEKIDGGLVNISVVPMFRAEHWCVTVQENIYAGRRIVIGRGLRPKEAVREAWMWVGDHGGGRAGRAEITKQMWEDA